MCLPLHCLGSFHFGTHPFRFVVKSIRCIISPMLKKKIQNFNFTIFGMGPFILACDWLKRQKVPNIIIYLLTTNSYQFYKYFLYTI